MGLLDRLALYCCTLPPVISVSNDFPHFFPPYIYVTHAIASYEIQYMCAHVYMWAYVILSCKIYLFFFPVLCRAHRSRGSRSSLPLVNHATASRKNSIFCKHSITRKCRLWSLCTNNDDNNFHLYLFNFFYFDLNFIRTRKIEIFTRNYYIMYIVYSKTTYIDIIKKEGGIGKQIKEKIRKYIISGNIRYTTVYYFRIRFLSSGVFGDGWPILSVGTVIIMLHTCTHRVQ